ncbi:MAG: hypothetical protein KC636_04100, partial [Myxococcales bacterium]|nr:hypothetical protein [Myxococcales bacterium]
DRLDEALALFGEALAIFIEIGDRACEGDCRVNVGRAQLACGEPGAVGMLERGRDLCAAMGRREYEAIAWLHLGEAHAAAGDERAALAAFTSARESFAAQESPLVWQASFGCARALHALGDDAEARAQATAALAQLEAQRARLPRHLDPSRLLASAGPLRALLDRLTVADAGARSEDAIISP